MKTFIKGILSFFIVLLTISGFSNPNDYSLNISSNKKASNSIKPSKEEKKLLVSARKDLAKENYESAKTKYLQLLKMNPTSDVYNYEAGLSFYFSTFERSKSIPLFEKALENSKRRKIIML